MSAENDFHRAGFRPVQDETYLGTYVFASLDNLLSQQSYNRGSKRWTKAEYVVLNTTFDGEGQKQRVLTSWREIVRYRDQYLLVPISHTTYTAYNYQGIVVSSGTVYDIVKSKK